jgi:hypothetical protein
MRHGKISEWIAKVLFLGVACIYPVFPALAEEGASLPAAGEKADPMAGDERHVYFEPEGAYFLGYRFVSTEDSLKAGEYIDPHSSVTFGVDLLSCPLPYRYHINSEYLSRHDFMRTRVLPTRISFCSGISWSVFIIISVITISCFPMSRPA